MKIHLNRNPRREAGYVALFITLILVGAAALVLGATLNRSASSTRMNDRNCLYISGNAAAEAAVEKVLARMMVDFSTGGEALVIQNSNYYTRSMLPSTSESTYWTNFAFSDGLGNANQIYVGRTTTNANPPFVQLEEQYAGLSGFAATWRIVANVSPVNSTYSYSFTNAVQQDIQLAEIPIFQFAIFYNSLLEFSDTAPLTVNGRVNANSNIYVGSPSDLTFNYLVTCTGNITAPANDGYSTSTWRGAVNYTPGNGNPGYLTQQPAMTLPIGTNNTPTAVHEIVNMPPRGESPTSPMGQQRYFNKAGLIVEVYDTNEIVILQRFAGDPSTVTTNFRFVSNFMSTNIMLYDDRENKTMMLSQFDIGKMTNWMNTNLNVLSLFPTNTSPLGIIYVADLRSTNSTTNTAVRLINGAYLPPSGLTVATPNPMYIQGIYNCPLSGGYLGTTNTTASAPASVICDALTILSPTWSDSVSFLNGIPVAGNDTVNTAIIAGIVYSTGTTSTTFSGGVENFPRLLEDWRSVVLTLNSSMICLYPSYSATHPFENPGNYYYAPSQRNFNFDQNYQFSNKLPPGTPYVDRIVRATWSNPPPGTVTYTPSPTLDFVAQ